MKLVFSIISALFVSIGTSAQSRSVNGLVLNEEMDPLCCVSIYINDWDKVGETDSKGKYEIAIPVKVDSLIFRGVGSEPLLVMLDTDCNRVDAFMVLAGSYDFMSLAKVDRKRRRHFNKIGKLYPMAIQKGLFAAASPCSKAIFQPNAIRKKEMNKQ